MNRWSKHWKSSKKPKKQRKYIVNAPLHVKHKMLSAHLSKELIKKYSKRNIPLKKGDKVKIMCGQFKGKSGKVEEILVKTTKVFIEGIDIVKKDGSKVRKAIHPSNLLITELNTDDKKRQKGLIRR